MRAQIALTALFTLVAGLPACSDDGGGTTNQTTQSSTGDAATAMTDATAGMTDASAGTMDVPTTTGATGMTSPTTTNEDTSVGTTTDGSAGTTTDASGTTTDASAGTTTDASGSTTDPSAGTDTGGMGGELYGPCEMDGPPCPGDQECLKLGSVEGFFCAPACVGMKQCPEVPEGVGAQAMCVLKKPMQDDASNCALLCQVDMEGQCPAGTTCKAVPMQDPPVGVCTSP